MCLLLVPRPTIHHDSLSPSCAWLQGHMRLLLLPVLYNAMAQSEDPNHHVFSPMFRALHAAMLASTYAPLVVKAGHGISHSALPAQQGEQVRPAACSWHVSAHHLGCCGAGIGMRSRCSNGADDLRG